jgi:hypothetical protein
LERETPPSSPSQDFREPRSLPYILVSAFAFWIGWYLSKTRTPVQPSINPDNPTSEANKQGQESANESEPRSRIESNSPPTITGEEKGRRKRKEFREWGILGVELVGLFGLFYYACTTYRMWREMQSQTAISQKQLAAIDRPWIKNAVTSWLDFRIDNNVGYWGAVISAENIGHSVAVAIMPEPKLIIVRGADFIDTPRRRAKEVCDELSNKLDKLKNDPAVLGNIVFPGTHVDFPFNIAMPPSEFKGISDKTITPMLIGCVAYRYPSSEDTHGTGFVYVLSHEDDPTIQEAGRVFFKIGTTIPRDKVKLTGYDTFAN